jgi:hypothetical protein
MFVPIFGYWIIFNDWFAKQTALVFESTDGPSLRLYASYFGLCFVAVASTLYQWKCPTEINQFTDASNFVRERCDSAGITEERRVQAAVRAGDELSEAAAATIKEHDRMVFVIPPANGEALQEHRLDLKREWFLHYYEMRDREYPRLRRWIQSLYAFGITILGFQSLEIFTKVTCKLVTRLAAVVGVSI